MNDPHAARLHFGDQHRQKYDSLVATVVHKDDASAIERLDHDLRYIITWSLWLDIHIIVRTAMREFISGSAE